MSSDGGIGPFGKEGFSFDSEGLSSEGPASEGLSFEEIPVRKKSSCPKLLRHEKLVLFFIFLVQVTFFPWFPKIKSTNELSRVYLSESLAVDHSVAINGAFQRHGKIVDRSSRKLGGKTQIYSDKAPGVSFLALPLVYLHHSVAAEPKNNQDQAKLLAMDVRLSRLMTATIPSLILSLLLLLFLKEKLVSQGLPAVLTLGYALGTVAMPYSILAFSHQLSALLLFSVFLCVRKLDGKSSYGRFLLLGFLVSACLIVEYQNLLLLLPMGLWFFYRLGLSFKSLTRGLSLSALGALPVVLLMLFYHERAFGSPFLTGYSFIASKYMENHNKGMFGILYPKWDATYLSFISSTKGIFFFSPWLVLAFFGLKRLSLKKGEDLIGLAFVMVTSLFVVSFIRPQGGWTVSQRYLVPVIPFLVYYVGLFLDHSKDQNKRFFPLWVNRKIPFLALLMPSIFALVISSIVWPHFPETMVNPFWNVAWPLFLKGVVPPSMFPFISSQLLTVLFLGICFVGLLFWLLLPSFKRHEPRAFLGQLLLVFVLSGAFVALQKPVGASQDLSSQRAWIEKVYVLDRNP